MLVMIVFWTFLIAFSKTPFVLSSSDGVLLDQFIQLDMGKTI